MDEHERDGRVAQRPRPMAEMTGGVRLSALVLAQEGVPAACRRNLAPRPCRGRAVKNGRTPFGRKKTVAAAIHDRSRVN
jgi:hypothetical protein